MSKTAQRKRQAYEEGLRDSAWNLGFRWERHPHMEQYQHGYRDGLIRRRYRLEAEREMAARRRWHNRVLAWISSRVSA